MEKKINQDFKPFTRIGSRFNWLIIQELYILYKNWTIILNNTTKLKCFIYLYTKRHNIFTTAARVNLIFPHKTTGRFIEFKNVHSFFVFNIIKYDYFIIKNGKRKPIYYRIVSVMKGKKHRKVNESIAIEHWAGAKCIVNLVMIAPI